jgi:hydroxymethylpyrimidine/phosphomethylpyrimidine kinase
MKNKTYYRLLTIAGSDCGGGAGIQADLKTFAALGCYGMSVITALTAQNTVIVKAIHEVPANFVARQIDAVLDDIGVDAVKIGMLHSSKIIRIVTEKLRSKGITNIVVDPIMIAKSGVKLLKNDAIKTLRNTLLPIATIVTPNIPEASLISMQSIRNQKDMEKAGAEILSLGPKAVLVKGGHGRGNICADCLCISDKNGKVKVYWFTTQRIITKNTHGTGCTFSSAIAAHLAKGFEIIQAVIKSKEYIYEAIKAGEGYALGKGHGPLHHFYKLWEKKKKKVNYKIVKDRIKEI